MRLLRTVQWVGILLVAASAFLPALHVRAYPGLTGKLQAAWIAAVSPRPREVPAQELGTAVVESLNGPDAVTPLWDVRRWYPWFLAPLWALALLFSRGRGRRWAGAGMLLLTFAIIVLEATYLRVEYLPFLSGGWGRAELAAVWLFIILVLLYRRPVDRHLGAVEAAIGAQGLLGFMHSVTLPATMFRQWLPGRDAGDVFRAVLHNFGPGFWLGMAGMLMMAAAIYLPWLRSGSQAKPREEHG